jgi:outer membrane protein assembly factor BamB
MMKDTNRIRTTIIAGLVCACAIFGWVDRCHTASGDWPLTRGDAASSGSSASPLPVEPELLWEFKLGGLGFDSGPIIADGRVFAADADGILICLSLSTGELLWKKTLETGFMASPAYNDGAIYIGDLDGVVRSLDASTGEIRWEYDAQQEIDAGANFFKDTVLVTSQSGSLLALDRASGELKWRYETDDQLQCGPTLAGNLTYLGGCDQHLHIVNVESGQPFMDKIPIDAPTGSTPAVHDRIVLVPNYKGQIWAFSAPTHELIWKFENSQLSNEFKNSVAVAGGFVVATSGNRRVFALDLANGEVAWDVTLRRRTESSPVIAGDQVTLAGSDGRLLLLDLKTGKENWMFEVRGSFLGSPAVADGKLVVASDRGDVFCFGKN